MIYYQHICKTIILRTFELLNFYFEHLAIIARVTHYSALNDLANVLLSKLSTK